VRACGSAVAEAGGVEAVAREEFVVEAAEIRHLGMPVEEPRDFVQRGRALRALHVQRDAGGFEERGDFSSHAKRRFDSRERSARAIGKGGVHAKFSRTRAAEMNLPAAAERAELPA
jgi:hypothetical protein